MKMYMIKIDEKEKFILQVICGIIIILSAAFIVWKCVAKEHIQLQLLEGMFDVESSTLVDIVNE